MKKVGIMTWYKYNNYGTVLQAMAMKSIIEENLYQPILINYIPKNNVKEIIKLKDIFLKLKNKLKSKKYSIDNSMIFENFRVTNFKTTEELDNFIDLKEYSRKLDAIICGSDQIWSPVNFDAHYFLDFSSENKILSYAPSLGTNMTHDNYVKKEIAKLVKRFKYLSVREEQGAKFLKDIAGVDAKVVLDPTLLLDENDWKNFESTKIDLSEISQKYVLCYFLGESNKYIRIIEKYAKENNLKIINIPVFLNKKINKYNLEDAIGPSEFLSLFKNANTVFTDSFHGLVFSINYKKNFYVFKRFKKNSSINQNGRIINILDKLKIENRIVEKNSNLNDIQTLNYSEITKRLDGLKKDSKDFLLQSLNKIINEKELTRDEDNKCVNTNLCTGCGACSAICPVGAIEIIDEKGFQHFKINKEKCIECGLCKKICPMEKLDAKKIQDSIKLYSFVSLDEKILKESSSGGFATVLSKYYNNKGYYVSGCYYDPKISRARHIVIKPNNVEKISKLSGSKYIQSISSDAINELTKLSSKEKVVFIGTPCQVAGLDKLLKMKKLRDNFILVDLICHGVPTINAWNKYLDYINDKYKISKKSNVCFRYKKMGWHRMHLRISSDKNEYVKIDMKDKYYKFFLDGTCYSESCFDCPYRQKSSADIRIGDYWGEKFKNEDKGVSMIISMNSRGEESIKELVNNCDCKINEEEIKDYWFSQFPCNHSKPSFREEMIDDLIDKNLKFETIYKKYYKYDFLINELRNIKEKLKGVLKK